jgi:predicted DsbA family dithiol-disulfide isomerase
MNHRKRCNLLLSVLLSLLACSIPAVSLAEVETNVLSTLNLDKNPVDVATTADGKWAYILTPGEIQVYDMNLKALSGRIPVDKEVGRISVSARGDQLFLMNEKTKTLSFVSVYFIHKIDVTGSPFKGPANAPVVIAVFSDYQCPFCAQLEATLRQVLEKYPKEVKLVHKDFPMPIHKFARQAAVAALAAGEQKKYWEYHEKIMQNFAALGQEKLLEFAKELGLDMDAFKKSLTDPKHEKHIDKDAQDAVSAGVQGTPAIFVNGRVLTNRTLEGFKSIIDDELNRKK